ncbi:peptidase family M1 [Onchocerca flexuosa]|uniref:Peptidase family M1 n=1 Tax=Onchocerca flexuosa TaxID=387005 RepID=A0A238BUQ9_9BILA|nr:peptidase family M1 [Onchocerca flexuosa]
MKLIIFKITSSLINTITISSSSTNPPINTSKVFLDIGEKTKVKNITLLSIYPPSSNSIAPRSFHFSVSSVTIQKHRKIPLSRLPRTLRPEHYDLQLDFTKVTSKEQIFGNVSVLLESYGNSTTPYEIVFHAAANIHIDKVRLHHRGKNVGIETFKRDQRARIIRLLLKQPLKHGWYALEMQFVTKICENNNGGVQCYRGIANDDNLSPRNQHLPIISFTTKFQPSLARTFFPCWDEPNWKATYNITILHSSSITVLTNAAPLHFNPQKQRRSFVRTKFRETPPIPTFLLAFAFGPYNSLERSTGYGVSLTIWTFPEDLIYAKFAANFSPYMFDQLAKEFVVPYPLSKIDFVAAHSFPNGGMENWGLIVFQKEMFLLDSLLESNANMTVDLLAEQYDIEKTITHELVHQWFGNLVTINDWSELWISEGFASYYVNDFLKKHHPALAINEYFLRLSQLLSRQTSNEKVPLVKRFRTEAEVENAFNPYHLYTKGAVIVKMIRDLVGENNFREGVRRFLKTNAYKSIGRSALWKAMPAFTSHGLENKKLENVIEPWLLNDGIPEVMVSRNYNYGSIQLIPRSSDQNRYIIYLRDVSHDVKNSKGSVRKTRGKKWTGESEQTEIINTEETSTSFFTDFVSDMWTNSKKQEAKRKQEIGGGRPIGERKKECRHRKLNEKCWSSQEQQFWSIPFTYQLSSKTNFFGNPIREFWLHNKTVVFVGKEAQTSAVLLANVNWKYPYRVNYDIENWKMLARLLHENHLSIPLYSRIQLILDSEFYLKQSNVPEIYLYILSYLTKENDVGLLLFGLDAIYRFYDMFRGSSINSLLLLFLREIIEWLDKVMDDTKTKPELAALWLLDANRLIQFYKLRCAINLSSCDPEDKVEKWLKSGGLAEGDHYSQMIAICHHLFTRGTKEEYNMVENGLKQFNGKWTTAIQLATCVRNEDILKKVANQIIATRNAAVYTAMLQNEFTLLYNKKFRALFWREIANMPLMERKLLFSIETDQTTQVAQILVHSIRSSSELEWLINTVPDWELSTNMSSLLTGTTLRQRRPVQEVVRDFDAFNKTVDEVSEEKRATGGFREFCSFLFFPKFLALPHLYYLTAYFTVASLSFIIIAVLVFGELRNYFYGEEGHYYRFSVDTAYSEHPELELDIIVATPCTNLMAHLTGTASNEFNSVSEFKHDPTRFEFTEKEAMYWNELKKVQRRSKEGTTLFKSLDEMTFVSGRVEEGLKTEAETKQREEAHAIQLERKKNPKQSMDSGTLILIGNGFNVFHVVASNSEKNEGTACRIHGRMRVNKVKGDSFVVSTGKGLGIDGIFAHFGGISNPGNVSHRIERFNFGPRIYGLVTPLAGIEQISETGVDEFRYFLKIVPTRIYHSGLFGGSTLTYQYSVTFMKKTPKKDVHKHAAIIIHYEFAATVIEVRRIQSSLLQLLVRLCSAVGGVFATSIVLNSICVRVSTVWISTSKRMKKIRPIDRHLEIVQPGIVIDT